jgi:hypothetical protein
MVVGQSKRRAGSTAAVDEFAGVPTSKPTGVRLAVERRE